MERVSTPEESDRFEDWLEKDRNRGRGDEPHWHIDDAGIPFLHLGKAWGRADKKHWSWMIHKGRRWWTVADKAHRMVRHNERWWWKTNGGWFLLQNGQPWAYRHFARWGSDGYVHPSSDSKIVYSKDGRRVALIAADGGARVFDAQTGELLAVFPAPKEKQPIP